jgi:uncharacterized protein YprB with RNaseH-like and TPR domain
MAQINIEELLPLLEESGKLAIWDSEATGLKGDYNSLLCSSIKAFGGKTVTHTVERPGKDRLLCVATKRELEKYVCWISFYGRGYDLPMLNTRLLFHGLEPVRPRLHLDMYWALKNKILTARKSQAHLLRWLELPTQKMDLSAEEWNRILEDFPKARPTMIARCESDVEGLESLYKRTKHLIRDVRR